MADIKARIRLEKEPLSQEIQQKAEKELRETPERVKEATVALRQLLKAETKLHYRDDDEFLLRFLRPTKFYPESALALMQRIADFRAKNTSHLGSLMPADEKSSFVDNSVVNVLVDRDQDGRRILVVNCGEVWDPSKVSADQLFRMFYLIHLGAMLEPETQVSGTVVIMDFNGLTMKQVMGLTPAFSMRLLTFIQDAMPLRLKEVHIVKQPFIFNMVFTMFKPFIKEKLKSRMFFHGKTMKSLHKHINPDFLPADYDGTKPKISYSSADWYPLIEDLNDVIAEWNTFGAAK